MGYNNKIMETISFDEASPAGGGTSQGGENMGNAGNSNSAPKAPINDGRKKKLIWAGVILAVLILSVIAWQYWQYTQTPYYKQMQVVKELEKMAKESDKWGGKTPEETVALFTDAVKKGDFDLASKYGNRDQIFPVLEKMKNEGKLEQLIKDFEIAKVEENPGFGGSSMDLMIEENGKKYWIMGLFKSEGGTWKIVEF